MHEEIPTQKHGEIFLSDKQFLCVAQMGTMKFNLSGYNWERWSSRRYIDVAMDHLWEDATTQFVFPEAVHSSKQDELEEGNMSVLLVNKQAEFFKLKEHILSDLETQDNLLREEAMSVD